jgi:hypothetical protein
MLETNCEYGYSGGDALNSFTNYVKVDNSAIKLTNFNKSDDSNTSIDAYLMNGDNYIRPDEVSGVKFYYGEWNSNYFKIKSGAPSGCPSTLPSTKEEIMNLYGGPCIEKTLA